MISKYFSSTAVAGFDEQVSRATARIADAGGGSSFVIGLKNESGEIYRSIWPSDAVAFLNISDALEEMGLVDDLGVDENSRDGYQAIYRLPERRARRPRMGSRIKKAITRAAERRKTRSNRIKPQSRP